MTEDLSQNSSGSQDTSQDSGVSSEGQLSNLTGENNAAQGNQNSQAPATQNNQNNKKYDLGVLFVHGIGNQKSGDTFSAIYPSIRDEFNSYSYLKYKEISRSFSRPSNGPTEATGEIYYGNIVKNVIFRESNWNKNYSNPVNTVSKRTCLVVVKDWIVSRISRTRIGALLLRWIHLVLNVINCLLLLLYFLGMKIISSRVYSFVFSLSAVFLFLFLRENLNLIFSNFQKISLEDKAGFYFSIAALLTPIFLFFVIWSSVGKWLKSFSMKSWILLLASLLILLVFGLIFVNLLYMVIVMLGVFVSCIILGFIFKRREIVNLISPLWEQVNNSADYIRTGAEFGYLRAVESDIKNLMEESDKIIIIAHSMGEYLAYKSLKRSIAGMACKEVQLIGVGGGLGPVSLMGSLRASDRLGKYSIIKSIPLSFGAMIQTYIILGGIFISFIGLVFDFYRSLPLFTGKATLNSYIGLNISNPYIPFETSSWVFNVISHNVLFVTFFTIGIFLEKIIGIEVIGDSKLRFFKYSHFLDPVGNFADFYYGKAAYKAITPNSSFAHSIRSYFAPGDFDVNSGSLYVTRYIYMRRRIVQHMVSTAYNNPGVLQKKTHSLKDKVVEVLSCMIALFIIIFVQGMDMKLFLVFLPIVAVFNYLILRIFLWIRVVAETTRDSSQNPRSVGDGWDVFFWLVVCLLIFFFTDIMVLPAIDTILSISVK